MPTSGRALDLACGTGAQSLWLAERGLDVVALDVSPAAIDLLSQAADTAGLDIDARVHDTDCGLPADLDDLDVIVCQRFRSVDLYGQLVSRLAEGGVLLLTVLSAVGSEGGRFHAAAGELIDAFGRHDVVHHAEGDGLASIAVRRANARGVS